MARILIRQAHGGATRIISDPALPYFLNQGWVVLDDYDDAEDIPPVYLSRAEGDLRWASIADLGDPASAEIVVISETVADVLVDPATGPGGALRAAFGLVYLVPAPTGVEATDQAAIQAVIDEASADGGGIVDCQDGDYAMNAELILEDRVLLRGKGPNRTTLSWAADLGTGFFAVRQPVGAGFQIEAPSVASLQILGPASLTLGVQGCDMDGWQVGRNVNGTDVHVRGFRAGGVFIGDHNKMDTCQFSSSYYNVLFPEDRLTSGNQVFINCGVTGAAFASIAVEGNVSIDSSNFIGGHTGFCPYGFYKFGTGGTSAILSNCLLDQLAFESIGNGAILDESGSTGAALYRTTIILPGHSWSDTYRIGARAKDYAVSVQTITDTYLRGTFVPGAIASFSVADGFSGMTIEYSDVPPTIVSASESPGPLLHTGVAHARYHKTSAAVAVGELLEAGGALVAPYGTNNREFAGVALTTVASGGWVPVAYEGLVSASNGSTAITAGGTPVAPDPAAPTKVRPLSSTGSNGYTWAAPDVVPSKHPVIGHTDRDIAANGTGNIWLTGQHPDRMYVAPGAVAALPTASDTYRGQMLRVEGASGVADGVFICMKDAANAYAWKAVTLA